MVLLVDVAVDEGVLQRVLAVAEERVGPGAGRDEEEEEEDGVKEEEEEWQETLMEAAIHRIKRKVDPKHYQAFELYVFRKWPVLKVSSTLEISPAKVYLIKHRIQRLIAKEISCLQARGM